MIGSSKLMQLDKKLEKYDLNDLFKNPPIFDVAPLSFEDKKPWKFI
jgi:hypothetical protein